MVAMTDKEPLKKNHHTQPLRDSFSSTRIASNRSKFRKLKTHKLVVIKSISIIETPPGTYRHLHPTTSLTTVNNEQPC